MLQGPNSEDFMVDDGSVEGGSGADSDDGEVEGARLAPGKPW